ncbi:MAG: type II secretion system protein [Patescibacteria group bacterium]|jgi:prepilin-type N-terminal cleavage/methylation domain-containing protein
MLKIKNLKGFTLIEILIATAILVMVGVAAIGVEKQFIGSAGVNKHKLQATALAQEGISAVRAAYNAQLMTGGALTPGSYTINTSGSLVSGASQVIPLNGVSFTRTITIP